MFIKICGVTTVEDGRVVAEAGADAVGLNFYRRSPRYVQPETAARIAAALSASVLRVGVFVDAPRSEVEAIAEHVGLDTLQFHGNEPREYCRDWPQRVIKAIRVRDRAALRRAVDYPVDFLLLDAYVEGLAGGTGKTVPWDWLSEISSERVILAGGLDPENVAEAVRRARPAGVDVASGVESTPGRKDAEKVRRFIANARGA